MKLISLSCPNCHAPMQINSELKQGMCNYCGYKFLVDKEEIYIKMTEGDYERIGKAAERARQNNEEKIAEETSRKLNEISVAMSSCEKISEEIEDIEYKIIQIETELKEKKSFNKFFGTKMGEWFLYIILSLMVLMALYSVSVRQAGFNAVKGTVIVAIILLLIFKIISYSLRREIPRIEEDRSRLLNQKENYEREICQLMRNADVKFVPLSYRHKDALRFMSEALRVRKAKTLNEAICQYEEEKERTKLRQLQRKQIEAQTRAMEEQERAAIAQRKAADAQRHAEIVEGVVMTGVMIKAGKGIVKEILKSLK